MIFERTLTTFLRPIIKHQLMFENTSLRTLPAPIPGHEYVLYVHVPFCETLCPYCSFNRFIYIEERARSYFKNLQREMQMVADLGYRFNSMYIGGGTPTIQMDELIKMMDKARDLFGIREISCETNPNHLIPEILTELQGRVDRLSVGVQSFNDELLKQMNRYARFGSGQEILGRIQQAARVIPVINVDMIFNLPRQTEEILKEDVQCIIRSNANQVTFNALMTSPGVSATLERAMGKVAYSREESLFEIIDTNLNGVFNPVSSWTFARGESGLIDEYIVDYEEYLGIGSGSFSYLDGALYTNTFSLSEYDRKICAGQMSVTGVRRYGKIERMRYRFLMELFGLRLDKKKFERDFGVRVEFGLPLEMAFMITAGAFEQNNSEAITLTRRGRYLLVAMMREFFSGVNRVREQARQALTQDERALLVTCDQAPMAGPIQPAAPGSYGDLT